MNYRHAFHAGGFADVVKHATLALTIAHLRAKPAAFRVLDTHAGGGTTDLAGPQASRTGEWRDGIGRIATARLAGDAATALAPYLEAVRALQPDPGAITLYPGSPHLALALMRPQDRLTACELHPDSVRRLRAQFGRDRRATAVGIDGWTALTAYVPARERRGVVLVDPPFEQPGEFARMAGGLSAAHRRWPSGIYLLWYPIKDRRETERFGETIARTGIRKVLRAEVMVRGGRDPGILNGCGLLIVNPPFTLKPQLDVLLPALANLLAQEPPGAARLDWLTPDS